MEENMKSLDELFAGVKTAAIAGHIRPDGDCVGSCLATYNLSLIHISEPTRRS